MILISRPLKFIIGPDEVPIIVYEAVFAEQSRALAARRDGRERSWRVQVDGRG